MPRLTICSRRPPTGGAAQAHAQSRFGLAATVGLAQARRAQGRSLENLGLLVQGRLRCVGAPDAEIAACRGEVATLANDFPCSVKNGEPVAIGDALVIDEVVSSDTLNMIKRWGSEPQCKGTVLTRMIVAKKNCEDKQVRLRVAEISDDHTIRVGEAETSR